MARTLTSTLVAAALIMSGGLAHANDVIVKVAGGGSMKVVLYADGPEGVAGRVLAVTDAKGNGKFDDDFVNSPKGQKIQVRTRKCDDSQQQLMLVAGSARPETPARCKDKDAAAYTWGESNTVKASMGWSATQKIGIAGGVGAGLAAVKLTSGGTSEPRTVNSEVKQEVGSAGSGSGSTTTTTPNPTSLNGTYVGNLNAAFNSCNFQPSASVRGVLSVDNNGRGTWQKTHVSANKTFNFNVQVVMNGATSGTFVASTSDQVGSRSFNIADNATINGATMNIFQTFTSTSGESCVVRYEGAITRQ